MGERQHYCIPQSSCSLRRGLYNYIDCAGSLHVGIVEGGGRGWGEGGGEGHLSLDVLFVGVGLNSSRLLLKEEVRLVVGYLEGFSVGIPHSI